MEWSYGEGKNQAIELWIFTAMEKKREEEEPQQLSYGEKEEEMRESKGADDLAFGFSSSLLIIQELPKHMLKHCQLSIVFPPPI